MSVIYLSSFSTLFYPQKLPMSGDKTFRFTDINLKSKHSFTEINILSNPHRGGQGSWEPSEVTLMLWNLKVEVICSAGMESSLLLRRYNWLLNISSQMGKWENTACFFCLEILGALSLWGFSSTLLIYFNCWHLSVTVRTECLNNPILHDWEFIRDAAWREMDLIRQL